MRRWLYLLLAVVVCLGVAACDKVEEGDETISADEVGANTTPTTIAPLTASEFHAVGERVFASIFDRDVTPAEYLAVSDLRVSLYETNVCAGIDPSFPKSEIYPIDVPAFEKIFLKVGLTCESMTERRLAAERGRVADAMASNQSQRLAVFKAPEVKTFCATFNRNSKITAAVLSLALEKVGFDEGTAFVVDIGVDLMKRNCSQWTPQLQLR